jgi:hypothetical protein
VYYPLLINLFAMFLFHPGGLAKGAPEEVAAIAPRLPPRPDLVNLLLESHDARRAA